MQNHICQSARQHRSTQSKLHWNFFLMYITGSILANPCETACLVEDTWAEPVQIGRPNDSHGSSIPTASHSPLPGPPAAASTLLCPQQHDSDKPSKCWPHNSRIQPAMARKRSSSLPSLRWSAVQWLDALWDPQNTKVRSYLQMWRPWHGFIWSLFISGIPSPVGKGCSWAWFQATLDRAAAGLWVKQGMGLRVPASSVRELKTIENERHQTCLLQGSFNMFQSFSIIFQSKG
jgi:hypothetical protein